MPKAYYYAIRQSLIAADFGASDNTPQDNRGLDMSDKDQSGERIAEVIAALGITQTEFGLRIGASKQIITDYVKGRKEPTPAVLRRMRDAFGISADFIISGDLARMPSDLADKIRSSRAA